MASFKEGDEASTLVAHYSSSVKGKTILTTGVTPGSIGAAYVEALAAASPALLILAGRNATKLDQEVEIIAASHPNVPTRKLIVDLMSMESVRKAADEVNSWADVPNIDVVMNCAGIMAHPYKLSPDGYESQFAANHIGHFLLSNLIMPKVLASEAPRVINVSSDGHRLGHMRWGDINYHGGKTYEKWNAYGQSKTANILMAVSLAKKLGKRGLLAYSLHPGLIMTSGLGGHLDLGKGAASEDFESLYQVEVDRKMGNALGFDGNFQKVMPLTSGQGAATSVYASFDPDLVHHNGKYLQRCHVVDPMTETLKPWATDANEAELLWRLSEDIVGQKFEY